MSTDPTVIVAGARTPYDPRYASVYGRGIIPSDVFSTGGVSGGRGKRTSDTWAMRFDISSQLDNTHLVKAGTPTMGGALILVAITISTLLWADLHNSRHIYYL